MTFTVQLKTVDYNNDPSEYFPENVYETVEYNVHGDTYREAHIATFEDESEALTTLYDACDYPKIVIEPPTGYDHPQADIRFAVYDGYLS